MQPRMIRVSDIERLQCTMENVPEQRVEEVTTMQAIRMLSSQIHAMQAEGYGLSAIAELLSDNGVVVTAKTLKTYLGEARAAGGRKNRRNAKTQRPVGTGAAATAPTTESKRAHAASGDAQGRSSGGRQGGSRGDDPSSACGARGDPEGDGATKRRRELTAVGLRAKGGHPRHLRQSERPAFGRRQRR
jgi:hypothetical protein